MTAPLKSEEGFELRAFSQEDIPAAGKIACEIWGDESGFLPPGMTEKIYEYLVRYYYVPGSSLNFAVCCSGKLCGFLLAAEGRHGSDDSDRWISSLLTDSERPLYEAYKAYLEGNRVQEMAYLKEKEVLLLLFASVRKGCGSVLMEAFLKSCRERELNSMLLWSDDTCDFDWYQRHDFHEVARFPASPSLPGRPLKTFIFRKEIE